MRLKHTLLSFLAVVVGGISYMYFAHFRPIPAFQPTGEYSIGATNFDFEFPSEISDSPRKLNIRAWYPSDASEGDLNLISSQRMVDKTVEFYDMPDFLATTEVSLSLKDAPIADGAAPFPVLIFNHGFGSFTEQSTVNMQELASHGYIVLSLSHPGSSLLTEYTDGSYVYYNPDLPAFVEQLDYEQASKNSFDLMSSTVSAVDTAENFDAYWPAMRTLAQGAPFANMQPILREWIEDSSAVIDAIAAGQTERFSTIFAAFLDKENIGLFGHSLGGMTALATSMTNTNIKAVINLDGPFAFNEPIENINLPIPMCMFMADGFGAGGDVISIRNINTPLFERAPQGGCLAIFNDAWHMNFSDLNYLSFLRLLKVLGPVNQEKFGIEQNHLLVSFFDRHLKGDDIPYAPVYDDMVEYREF